jgi:riboflavin synthase
MFTGIISEIGKLEFISEDEIHITYTNNHFSNLEGGTSIAVNGCCLTLRNYENNKLVFQVSKETLSKTNINPKNTNYVNLELPATLTSFLSGHIVQGHVDNTALVDRIEQLDNDMWNFYFKGVDSKYIIQKGSITINGISLTVVDPKEDKFHVAIITETYNRTNLQYLKEGDTVNIEYDMIAKYIEKQK